MSFTVAEIAARVAGDVEGDGSLELLGFAPAATAGPGDLTFADNEDFLRAAEQTEVAAILVSGDLHSPTKTLIRVPQVRVGVARLLPLFFPPDVLPAGIDPSARVAASAQIDATAHLGPGCVIGEGVRIGARSTLAGGNHVGNGSQLGDEVALFPNVVLYARTIIGHRVTIHAGTTIGSDGYGYAFDEGRHLKVLQVGNVVIHDDVEIGANAAIDRGALGSTIIGAGTKIDNLVHVAHNVVFGEHCLIMGQVGFAGSTHLGDYTIIASQAGIAGHLKLGRQSKVGAKSGVMRDIPVGGTVLGIPAQPDKQMKRQWIALQQLPELLRKMKAMEKQIAALQAADSPTRPGEEGSR